MTPFVIFNLGIPATRVSAGVSAGVSGVAGAAVEVVITGASATGATIEIKVEGSLSFDFRKDFLVDYWPKHDQHYM